MPATHSSSACVITPLEHPAGFGAEVTGVDLNRLEDADFKRIEDALYRHKLLVIRGQKELTPESQYAFNMRFDPESPGHHGHGGAKEVMKAKVQGRTNVTQGQPSLPCVGGQIRIVGKGTVPAGHYGTDASISLGRRGANKSWHIEPLSSDELATGHTRFDRFHIDAQLYPRDNYLARVTTIWAHTLPKGPDVCVRLDDGSSTKFVARPGRTAFIDGVAMYKALSDEDKAWVKHSKVEYAAAPYEWILNCHGTNNGFSIVSQGKELSAEDLPHAIPEQVQILPLAWTNPVTGELALQFHQIIARRLHVRTSADAPYEIIEDLTTVRKILDDLQYDFLRPGNVLFSPQEEGDLAVWYNRGLRHTAVDYPDAYGARICHQIQLRGSDQVV